LSEFVSNAEQPPNHVNEHFVVEEEEPNLHVASSLTTHQRESYIVAEMIPASDADEEGVSVTLGLETNPLSASVEDSSDEKPLFVAVEDSSDVNPLTEPVNPKPQPPLPAKVRNRIFLLTSV
jgi:hypothetical protein